MGKQGKSVGTSAKTGRFVVGRAGFEKISAVEGITPTKGMKDRASEAKRRGMTAEEYRSSILRNYRKG